MRTPIALLVLCAACDRAADVVPLPGPEKQPPAGVGCSGKSVIARVCATLTRLCADGSSSALFHFGDGLPDEDVVLNDWQKKNDFIGACAFLDDETGGTGIRYEYLVQDPVGPHAVPPNSERPHNPMVHLGSDGTLAVAGATGWIVRNGTVSDLGELMPLAPLLGGNQLPVARGQPLAPTSPKGLLALDTMRFTALSPAPAASFCQLFDARTSGDVAAGSGGFV